MQRAGEDVLRDHHGAAQADRDHAGHDDRAAPQGEGDQRQRDEVEAAGDPVGRREQVEGEHAGHERRRDGDRRAAE